MNEAEWFLLILTQLQISSELLKQATLKQIIEYSGQLSQDGGIHIYRGTLGSGIMCIDRFNKAKSTHSR